MKAHIAALQMVSSNDLDANLNSAANLIAQAATNGAKLVVLPETFALFSGRKQQQLGRAEASAEAKVRPFLSEQAKHHKLWIVGGSVPLAVDGSEKVLSSCFVFDDNGEERCRYDKIHLFDVDVNDKQGSYRESDTFLAGNKITVIPTPYGRLGLAICYDIRFPELFRAMFKHGVDLIAVPAAFTLSTGEAHWLALLRARAIENQCYIIGANQGGQHSPSRYTSGGSTIIDSWGRVLAEAGRGEQCVIAEIDLAVLEKQRQTMPIAKQLRDDMFKY